MTISCKEIRSTLLNGGIAVIATDTLYGIVARAEDAQAVERVYSVRGRDKKKPCIVLISDKNDLALFNIALSEKQRAFLEGVWPGKMSVVLPCRDKRFAHIHRGVETIAFRLPAHDGLLALIRETGPLIAPSANPAGLEVAHTIAEARSYFGASVDAYCDDGALFGQPSMLVSLVGDKVKTLRQ